MELERQGYLWETSEPNRSSQMNTHRKQGFIAESVRINNKVQFAFLCLGVVLLAVILQCLHRICRMYDRVLHQNRLAECSHESPNRSGTLSVPNLPGFFIENGTPSGYSYTATLGEQSIRAMLYTLVLAISYLILGLMLSFNGYIIFCALAGAWLGNLAFGVDSLRYVNHAILNRSN